MFDKPSCWTWWKYPRLSQMDCFIQAWLVPTFDLPIDRLYRVIDWWADYRCFDSFVELDTNIHRSPFYQTYKWNAYDCECVNWSVDWMVCQAPYSLCIKIE
jgi:hypothetical protein